MSTTQLASRTITYTHRTPAHLPNHTLTFHKQSSKPGIGYATILPSPSSTVHGVLYYGLGKSDYENLDMYEGVAGGHYRRVLVHVVGGGGKVVEAVTYFAGEGFVREGLRPSREYLGRLLEGADMLPVEYVEGLRAVKVGWVPKSKQSARTFR
ncbi:hypothetical protein HDV00_002780 [Rhizophlyctis rosea]|nr:hypothetical protein HDV00_002780 [Rhizophlyctis rosea]